MPKNTPQIQARFDNLTEQQQEHILFAISMCEKANLLERPAPKAPTLKELFLLEPFTLFPKIRPSDDRVARALIELWNIEEYAKPNVGDLADVVFLTPNHLRYLCKKSLNKNFREIGYLFAVEKCKKALKNTQEKIINIAKRYGFTNQSHFDRVFKSITRKTPREYRR
jgi:AraC-like DNA-binding protein